MAKWIVDRDGHQFIIDATPGGPILLYIVPAGEPFSADPEALQDIRIKMGAAVAVALGGDES